MAWREALAAWAGRLELGWVARGGDMMQAAAAWPVRAWCAIASGNGVGRGGGLGCCCWRPGALRPACLHTLGGMVAWWLARLCLGLVW